MLTRRHAIVSVDGNFSHSRPEHAAVSGFRKAPPSSHARLGFDMRLCEGRREKCRAVERQNPFRPATTLFLQWTDIAFAASFLARYTASPIEGHWQLSLRPHSPSRYHARGVGGDGCWENGSEVGIGIT